MKVYGVCLVRCGHLLLRKVYKYYERLRLLITTPFGQEHARPRSTSSSMTHENSSSRQPPLHWRATQSCEQLLVNKLTFADEAAVRAARGVYVLLGPRPT